MVVMIEIEPCARVSNHIDIEVRSKVQTSDTEREKEKIGDMGPVKKRNNGINAWVPLFCFTLFLFPNVPCYIYCNDLSKTF